MKSIENTDIMVYTSQQSKADLRIDVHAAIQNLYKPHDQVRTNRAWSTQNDFLHLPNPKRIRRFQRFLVKNLLDLRFIQRPREVRKLHHRPPFPLRFAWCSAERSSPSNASSASYSVGCYTAGCSRYPQTCRTAESSL